MMGRIKRLLAVLLSGVIWIGVHTNALAAAIDLEAEGLVANPMGAFFTEAGTGISDFDGTTYIYSGSALLDPLVGITSSPGVGNTDFSLTLNGFSGILDATSTAVMDSETSIDILFSITFNSFLDISGTHVLASIVHNDDLLPPGATIFSQPTTDGFASIALTSVAPIPLPMGIVLLLSSLGGLILVRRRMA